MKTAIFFVVCMLLASCFKEVATRTVFVLKPVTQVTPVDEFSPLEGVVSYSYAVDTTAWGIASYEDALAGIITSKNDPSLKKTTPEVMAEPYASEGAVGWVKLTLTNLIQMVVAVDPVNKIYAYTQQELPENLFELYVTLPFLPAKEGFSYKLNKWSYYNEFYVPPVKRKCSIFPKIQTEQGGPESPPATSRQILAYAYAVDTTLWYVASYQDALSRKITSKTQPTQTRTSPNFEAYYETTGAYSMLVTLSPLMVVVVDNVNKLYAYSKQEVDIDGEDVIFPAFVFRPWDPTWIEVQTGWRVVNEQYKPAEPETPDPENPETPSKR